jgi:Zn-dependent peptidase ImmA (M78 family)
MGSRNDDIEKARTQAREKLEDLGISSLPIKPREIAGHFDIHFEEETLRSIDGNLARCEQTYLITVPSHLRESRKRFSGAHELGHFFIQGHMEIFIRNYGCPNSDLSFNTDDPFELEANAFAAELLMPSNLIRPFLHEDSPLESVVTISEECETSLHSSAIQYTRLAPKNVALVHSKDNEIQYCFLSDSLKGICNSIWYSRPTEGDSVPRDSATFSLNGSTRSNGEASKIGSFKSWFPDSKVDEDVYEEAKQIGSFGTLTLLTLNQKSTTSEADFSEDYNSRFSSP